MKRSATMFIFLSLVSILITGCATKPPTLELNKLAPNYSEANITKEVFARNIFVETVGIKPNNLELAIMHALHERGMYVREKWRAKYVLTVRIRDEVAPKFGLSMKGSIAVYYKFDFASNNDRPYNQPLFEKIVRTEATGNMSDKLLGVERSLFVVEKYIKANVEQLLRNIDASSYGESQRIKSIELARKSRERRINELSQKIVDFDIFSRPTFFEVYPYETNQNYSMSEIIKNTKGNLLKRLMSARRDDLIFFIKTYDDFLDEDIRRVIEDSLRRIERAEATKKRAKRTPPNSPGNQNTWGLPPLPN